MNLKANEVFVPGAFPRHTYVERPGQGFENTLTDALGTPGQVVSLSGPSKSGKTVLVEKVVGRDLLISISGASIRKPDDLWNLVLDWIGVPDSTTASKKIGGSITAEVSAKGTAGLPVIVKGEVGGSTGGELAGELAQESVRQRGGLQQIVKEIGDSDFVILLDDFHYMPRDVQVEVAKYLKEAVRLGVKIVTASVLHRGDDVVRANPELRGRVRSIDLAYWTKPELQRISQTGFSTLNAIIEERAEKAFLDESAGSPQLMQLLCLQTCFAVDLRERADTLLPRAIPIDHRTLAGILNQTSASTDFRSLVDVLDSGPRVRGTERKTYRFKDTGEGDVYRVVLKAVAADPPRLSFPYEEILRRTAEVCLNEVPVGSSLTGTCVQMAKIALEKFPNERAIDWDEQKQVLDIPDPYLLFYLRWSNRLYEQ